MVQKKDSPDGLSFRLTICCLDYFKTSAKAALVP